MLLQNVDKINIFVVLDVQYQVIKGTISIILKGKKTISLSYHIQLIILKKIQLLFPVKHLSSHTDKIDSVRNEISRSVKNFPLAPTKLQYLKNDTTNSSYQLTL